MLKRGVFERLLVHPERRCVIRLGNVIAGRQFSFEQSGALQFVEARQVRNRVQPELDQKLDSIGLRQLKQRIALRAQLGPLDAQETKEYIEHRLKVAGAEGAGDLFPPEVIQAIYRHSRGFPRLINTVCENALIIAYARQNPKITVDVVEDVAREFRLDTAFFGEPEGGGTHSEMDVHQAAKVLRDLYSALRKPVGRGADLNLPVSLETSEYEPNI